MRLLFVAGFAVMILGLFLSATADVVPNPVFSDNCVLQRGVSVPVWGSADSGERISVAFQDQTVSTICRNGRWQVRLKPLKPGGPFRMTISGKTTVHIENVLVGEVWLASGQSNMAFGLQGVPGAQQEIATASDPMLRQATVTRTASLQPLKETRVTWKPCTPETAGEFSAVAYYFAKNLRAALGCPVGILNAARGGTRVEAWMSEECLSLFAGQYDPKMPKSGAESANWNTASALWNGIISPIVPYAIRGVVWYQGESNAGAADLYRQTFTAMIADWRAKWGQGLFPFLFVQLAPFGENTPINSPSPWAELREAQLNVSLAVPNTAMAVTTDCGDCTDIHPTRKKPVGDRLALAARALAYGESVAYNGPLHTSMHASGNRAVISFDNADGGLVTSNKYPVQGFVMAGPDGRFYPARARVLGSRVVVSSPDVTSPTAVRYGWADCPTANLFNSAGLPASPFRTDPPKRVEEVKP